jgi:hypothetical protein
MFSSLLAEEIKQKKKQAPSPESASEIYRPSDRCLSAKLVSAFADKECHVVSVEGPYGRILGFLDREEMKQEERYRMAKRSVFRDITPSTP